MTASAGVGADAIPFSRPFRAKNDLRNLERVLESDHAHGDGAFTRSATGRLLTITDARNALLTTSCTHALEMSTRLLGIGPGDEVILPTFTFPSAANAIALTGARCVFVDIDPASGNIDPEQVDEAVGAHTKAVIVMHYGGMPVDLDAMTDISTRHGIPIIEDNAHGLGVSTAAGVLGTIGVLATQSFHDTKNVHCGEGGALIINDASLVERAEIMREKGTNRSQFLRGQVDKYSWVDLGSSYLMSEFNAAVLDAQLEDFVEIQASRFAIWDRYATELAEWAAERGIAPMNPAGGVHAAHVFFLLMPDWAAQEAFIGHLRHVGVTATFHYVPLDTSPAGREFGRTLRQLDRAEDFSRRLVRLPLWAGMTESQVGRVIAAALSYTE